MVPTSTNGVDSIIANANETPAALYSFSRIVMMEAYRNARAMIEPVIRRRYSKMIVLSIKYQVLRDKRI